MSVADEITTLNNNLKSAYTKVAEKGGTVPTNKNTQNLPAAIASISGGGGDLPEPLDPEEVYAETRPLDWPTMPVPDEGEIYFLLKPTQDKFNVNLYTNTQATVEIGKSVNGEFIADSDQTKTTSQINSIVFEKKDIGDYLFIKISSSSNLTFYSPSGSTSMRFLEIASNNAFIGYLFPSNQANLYSLRYFTNYADYGTRRFDMNFSGSGLIAFIDKGNFRVSKMNNMFNGCASLKAVSVFDTSNCNSFNFAFSSCINLEAIGDFDTSSCTNFSSAFAQSSLAVIPNFDYSIGTNFSNMFGYTALKDVNLSLPEALDLSSMFTYSSIKSATISAPKATNCSSMFYACSKLKTVSYTNSSNVTSFSGAFSSTTHLEAIDIDTSSCTSFYGIFSYSSIPDISSLDVSSGTEFTNAFQSNRYIKEIELDLSNATSISSIFYEYINLKKLKIKLSSSCKNINQAFTTQKYIGLDELDLSECDLSNVTSYNQYSYPLISSGGTLKLTSEYPLTNFTNRFTGYLSGNSTDNPTKVIIYGDQVLQLGASCTTVFTGINNHFVKIYVKDELVEDYKTDTNWSAAASNITPMSELEV